METIVRRQGTITAPDINSLLRVIAIPAALYLPQPPTIRVPMATTAITTLSRELQAKQFADLIFFFTRARVMDGNQGLLARAINHEN